MHPTKEATIRKLPVDMVIATLSCYGFSVESLYMGGATQYTVIHIKTGAIHEFLPESALREIVIARMRREIMDTQKPKKRC
jgi:hypothetical protein